MLETFKDSPNFDVNLQDLALFEFRIKNPEKTIRCKRLSSVWIPTKSVDELIDNLDGAGFVCHHAKYKFIAVNKDTMITFSVNSRGFHSGTVFYIGKGSLSDVVRIINKSGDASKKLEIKWFTDDEGSYEQIYDTSSYVTKDSIYPFVSGVSNYVQEFLASSESIIILIGEPGTGKTNFIRTILYAMEQEVYLSFNEKVLASDGVFASFMCDVDAGAFVIEDADLLLKSREIGNETMSKFLNIGDGLIRLNGKKLIFSTNLESINDIDPAIIRPGRCFDVLHFRKLTHSEANAVCVDYGLQPIIGGINKQYSLSEIFNRDTKKQERKFGFL